jgi:DNA-binding transcriptional LysR family regulator
MELRHLRYFIAAAEELNLRRAADRLHLSHPPLSRQLADLEQMVGTALLVRGRRGLALTDAGRLFLAEARQIVAHSVDAIALARSAGRGEAGRLKIACSNGYFEPSLPRVMRAFRERFPQVRLEIQQLLPQRQLVELDRRTIDLAYIGLRFPAASGLAFECIRRGQVRAALPPGHPLCHHSRLPLRHLADQPFISMSGSFPDYPGWLLRLCATAGFVPRVLHEADTATSLFGLVSAGFGVAILPALHDPPSFEIKRRIDLAPSIISSRCCARTFNRCPGEPSIPRAAQRMIAPPSTWIAWPVTYRPDSRQR